MRTIGADQMLTQAQLLEKKCQVQVNALSAPEVGVLLQAVPGWQPQGQRIVRTFGFKDYHQTIAFVNAVADVAHAEDHHPELSVTYNRCIVKFDTHSVNGGAGGLSENDFICAAMIDAVFAQCSQ